MSELHLDLCRQSTNHLRETLANIKDNMRILEVFINSGLSDDVRKLIVSNTTFTAGENAYPLLDILSSSEGRRDPEKSRYGDDVKDRNKHEHCCCMCSSRLRHNSSSAQYANRNSSSSIGNSRPSSVTPKRPVSMPRLNRTASLRRETVIEKTQKQEMSTASSMRTSR